MKNKLCMLLLASGIYGSMGKYFVMFKKSFF